MRTKQMQTSQKFGMPPGAPLPTGLKVSIAASSNGWDADRQTHTAVETAIMLGMIKEGGMVCGLGDSYCEEAGASEWDATASHHIREGAMAALVAAEIGRTDRESCEEMDPRIMELVDMMCAGSLVNEPDAVVEALRERGVKATFVSVHG